MAPATAESCGRYTAYNTPPTAAHSPRYDAMKTVARPPVQTRSATAGAAPGSIIAAIMDVQTAAKNPNEPSAVSGPSAMAPIRPVPAISRIASAHAAAEPTSVAVNATAPRLVITARNGLIGTDANPTSVAY